MLFVLSARERIGAGDRFIAQRVYALGVPVVIALNKVDRLKGGHIAQQMQAAANLGDFHALHPVSAKTGDGIAELRDELVGLLPEGPLYFPAEQRTDLPLEAQIAELVREKALVAHPRRGAARDLRRGRGAGREGAAREHPRRDRLAEADPRRQGRRDGQGDRHARAPGDRGAARPPGLPRARWSRCGRTGAATRRRSSGSASSSFCPSQLLQRADVRDRAREFARTAGLAFASAASCDVAGVRAEPLV